MGKEVLVFLHMDDEHPGYIADYLQRRGIPFRVIRPYRQEPVPALDDSMAGLVFMGGVMSVNDELDWLEQEVRLIRDALTHSLPVLGHCLGGQLISRALGQTVKSNPVKEVGWHDCYRAETSTEEDFTAWLQDVEEPFGMFHWHSETFSIPPQGAALFSSKHCKNQAYSYSDNVLAMQCHVEMTLPQIRDWTSGWKEDLRTRSASEQDFDEINAGLVEKIAALNRVADRLYSRWVSTLDLSPH